jgi:hypothetical protein
MPGHWLIGVARRPTATGFTAPDAPRWRGSLSSHLPRKMRCAWCSSRSEKHPLHMHVIEVCGAAVRRQSAIPTRPTEFRDQSGGVDGLPDSAEAAAMARSMAWGPRTGPSSVAPQCSGRRSIRGCCPGSPMMATPRCRNLQRGLGCGTSSWREPDGYLRFRRSLLRDAAYEGLPYKLRRRLHGAVAAQHCAGIRLCGGSRRDPFTALLDRRRSPVGLALREDRGSRAAGFYAYVEAAKLYMRALEARRSSRGCGCAGDRCRATRLGRCVVSDGRVQEGGRRVYGRAQIGRERCIGKCRFAAQALARRRETRQVWASEALG